MAGLKAVFYELRFPFDHMEHIAAEHGGASKKSFNHYANCFQNLSSAFRMPTSFRIFQICSKQQAFLLSGIEICQDHCTTLVEHLAASVKETLQC